MEFNKRWNFPNCLGAMDGKHIHIQAPKNSGSYYYNYKKSFSIVFLALVNANYEFLYVDIGCNGRISDGGVFRNSNLSQALGCNSLNFPPPKCLPGGTSSVPHVVADEAFPLKSYLMKPFPISSGRLSMEQRVFNYRLSRARRIVENVFGIVCNRFRVLRTCLALEPPKAESIVLACCVLHNFLRKRCATIYSPPGTFDKDDESRHVIPGLWRLKHLCLHHLNLRDLITSLMKQK